MADFRSLIVAEDLRPFARVEPPFNFNAVNVAAHPPEVTGAYILNAVLQRLGWESFGGKTVLDFGCGVRFARTIRNLNIAFGRYIGVDVNAQAIAWPRDNITDERFRFEHLNAANAMYNPAGEALSETALQDLVLPPCDAATMFSVITHQSPPEAELSFRQIRCVTKPGGFLYFTAFIDEALRSYTEATPASPGLHSTYHPDYLIEIVERAGWRVRSIHRQRQTLQKPVFICTRT